MRKVLIVTYYWPPAGGPGVQRVLKIVKRLPELGWQPIILTVSEGDYPAVDHSLSADIPESCIVHKTSVIEPFNLYRKLTGKSQGEKIPTFVLNPQKSDSIPERLAKWVRVKLFIPDARIGWRPFAIRAGKRIIHDQKIDLIFSTSPPHSLQLIARRLAKKTGTPWVADFRDPWTEAFWLAEIQKTGVVERINRRLEKQVLGDADAVVSVSSGIVDLLRQKQGNNYVVIQNGYEPLELAPQKTERFEILFFGHLNKYQHRDTLFRAIEKLPNEARDQIKVVFVGKTFDGFGSFLAQFPNIHTATKPYMSYDKLIEYAQNACMLYRPLSNISYAQSGVGAKTYDYFALRKPILAIGPEKSFIARALKETESGCLFVEDDITGVSNYIMTFLKQWREVGTISLESNPALKNYQTDENVQMLTRLFEETLKPKQHTGS